MLSAQCAVSRSTVVSVSHKDDERKRENVENVERE